MPFMPMVDGVTRDRTPIELVAAGGAADVDMLIGTCAEECRLFIWAMPEAMQALIPIPDPSRWFAPTGRSDDDVRKVYASARPDADEREVGIAIWTDAMFTIPAARLADAQRAHNENVWSYRLSWRTPILDGDLGACHALDIPRCSTASISRRSSARTRRRSSRTRCTARGCGSRRPAIRTAAPCPSGRATTR